VDAAGSESGVLARGGTRYDGVDAYGGDSSVSNGGAGIFAQGGLSGGGTRFYAGYFSGDVWVAGCLQVASNPTVGSCTSDVRLKKNI
jgi:hypothetical protein